MKVFFSAELKNVAISEYNEVINTFINPMIYKFFKDFTNHRKKTNRAVVFSCRPSLNILKYRDHR